MSLRTRFSLALAIVMLLALIGLNFFSFEVQEGQSALLIRFGAPVRVVDKAGLQFRFPLIDSVQLYDNRVTPINPRSEQIILGDQKRIEVQTYSTFRISDPLTFFRAVQTVDNAKFQLSQIINSSLRRELGKINLKDLLTPERDRVLKNIEAEVREKSTSLGVTITQVRLHRADLPEETRQAIFDRMKSERQREAKELRAQGFQWAQEISSEADRERTVLISQAERDAAIMRGEADAQATRIVSEEEGKDPQFYRFYRSLATYQSSLAASHPTLILSPSDPLVDVLRKGPTLLGETSSPDKSATTGTGQP